jgi:hypothetical protein
MTWRFYLFSDLPWQSPPVTNDDGPKSVRTLDSWQHLLAPTPHAVEFPSMELMTGRDHEPTVLSGRGQVLVKTPGSFEYTMDASQAEAGRVLRLLHDSERNPYDFRSQFRLVGRDEQGIEWHCGWTRPTVLDVSNGQWSLVGRVNVLSTEDRRASSTSSVELVFLMPAQYPVGRAMTALVLSETPGRQRPVREYLLEVMGTQLHFAYDPATALLSVTGRTSALLPHPLVENWIGEPLRIMFGQLIYPRLSARNFGDGSAAVSLRPSPAYILEAEGASLWFSDVVGRAFWDLYLNARGARW